LALAGYYVSKDKRVVKSRGGTGSLGAVKAMLELIEAEVNALEYDLLRDYFFEVCSLFNPMLSYILYEVFFYLQLPEWKVARAEIKINCLNALKSRVEKLKEKGVVVPPKLTKKSFLGLLEAPAAVNFTRS